MKKDKSFRKISEKYDEEIEKIIRSKELTIKIEKRSKKKDIIIGITPIVKDNKAIEEKRKIEKELIENQRKYFEKQKKIVDERMKAELAKKEEEITRKNKMQEEIVARQLKEQLIKKEEDEKINKEDNEEKEKEKEKIKEEKMEEDDIDDSEQESIIEKANVEEKKCSHEDHKENDAISFCQECNIFMCNKCDKMHSELFKNHIKYNIDKNMIDIFTGLCKEKNHSMNLDYFCNNHNKLCCAACLCKIKGKGNGKHKNCEVCFISEIKDKKRNILKNNIKYLEDLSKTIEQLIQKLKNIFQKLIKSKEDLKLKIENIFTKIRNKINDREEELFLEVDELYDKIYFKEDLIKNSESLPNEIKLSLEKGSIINKEWNEEDNKLRSLINDCINIENIICNISQLNQNLKKSDLYNDLEIKFCPEDNEMNYILEIIKNFGYIYF